MSPEFIQIVLFFSYVMIVILSLIISLKVFYFFQGEPKKLTPDQIWEQEKANYLIEKAKPKNPSVVKIEVVEEPEFTPHFKAGSKEVKYIPTNNRPKAFLETKRTIANLKSKNNYYGNYTIHFLSCLFRLLAIYRSLDSSVNSFWIT